MLLSAFWLVYVSLLPAPAQPASVSTEASTHWWLVLGGAAAASGILYWRSLGVGMLSDDYVLWDWARSGLFVGAEREFVRPIPLLLWRAVYQIGAGSMTLHAVNVILHGMNAAATFALARANGLRRSSALMAAAIFLCWPTQVEAVTWSSGVFDVLATTFVTSSVLLGLVAKPIRTTIAGIFCALATLTKESGLALPALVVLMTAPLLRRRSLWLFVLISILWCAGYGYWRVVVRAGQHRTPAVSRYLLKEQASRTIGPLAVPVPPASNRPRRAFLFAAATVVLGFGATLWTGRRSVVSWTRARAFLWALTATAPAAGYLFIGPSFDGTRYLYLSCVGWAIFLAGSFDEAVSMPPAMQWFWRALGVGILIAAVGQNWELQSDWRSAAILRDQVLADAVRAANANDCHIATFTGAPDRLRGAQVFLNGLDTAVADARRDRPQQSGPECHFAWGRDSFAPTRPGQ